VSDIFISYANADRPRVEPLVDALQQQGWSVWWDRKILAGRTYDKVIEGALKDARCVIVLWSRDSIESDWVRTEADNGKKREILVPVLLDAVDVPLAFNRIQAANLVGWSGVLPSAQFDDLALAVSEVLSTSASSAPEPATPHPRAEAVSAATTVEAQAQAGKEGIRQAQLEHQTLVEERKPATESSRLRFSHAPSWMKIAVLVSGILIVVSVLYWALPRPPSEKGNGNATLSVREEVATRRLVDGRQTLDQQERTLNYIEQMSSAKVITYAEASGTTNNVAGLDDVPIGQQPGPLSLVTAADATQTANVIAAQKTAGKTLAFQGKAFVQSKETIVLGFR